MPYDEFPLKAWRALYGAYWRTSAAIEADLAAAGLPPLAWYDVLFELYSAPARKLRMSDLAENVLLSRSGLSRLVDRLEREKLLLRTKNPEDGRGCIAELTAAGHAQLRKIWPVYREGISKYLATRLSADELSAITKILGKFAPTNAE